MQSADSRRAGAVAGDDDSSNSRPAPSRRHPHDHHPHPRCLHPWPLAARHLVGSLGRPVHRGGLRPVAPGWPGVPDTAELARATPGPHRRSRHRKRHRALRRHHRQAAGPAHHHRALLRRHDRREAARRGLRRGRDRDRRRTDQGRPAAAAIRAALHAAGLQEPRQLHRAVSLTAEQFRYASATRYSQRSRTRCTSNGPSPRPASRSSRRPAPTSPCTRRRRSTPATRSGVHCY